MMMMIAVSKILLSLAVPLIKNQRSDFHVSFGISQKKVIPRPRLTRLEKLHTHLRFLAL